MSIRSVNCCKECNRADMETVCDTCGKVIEFPLIVFQEYDSEYAEDPETYNQMQFCDGNCLIKYLEKFRNRYSKKLPFQEY